MITAAITALIAGVLGLFGIKPGAYLVGVAIAVKIVVVGFGVLFGMRWARKRGDAAATPRVPPAAGPDGPGAP